MALRALKRWLCTALITAPKLLTVCEKWVNWPQSLAPSFIYSLCNYRRDRRLMRINVKHALSYALPVFCMKYVVTLIVADLILFGYYFFMLKFTFHWPIFPWRAKQLEVILGVSWALLTCNYMHAFLGMRAKWLCMAFTIFTCILKPNLKTSFAISR